MKTSIIAITAALCAATPAFAEVEEAAETDGTARPEIIVTAPTQEQTIINAPNTSVTVDSQNIQTRINAVSVEDTLKYLPSLIIRKRHVGDNFAPIATRTSGLGSSARSLIFADGILLSALINNNNGNGSPKWQLVSPEEISRIDVLYGPFSAAYSGNGIGTVVNITTHLPEELEVNVKALGNVHWHKQYTTSRTLETGQFSASVGDSFGAFGFFASATHTISNGQPVAYVTAATAPAGTTGSIPTFNRLGQPIQVLGASDIDHHVQDTLKLKLRFDLSETVRLSYVGGLFLDDSRAEVETYLRNPAGSPVYTTGFNSGFYLRDNRHWAHSWSLDGDSDNFDWQAVATLYDYARDVQSNPTALLPASASGGGGTVQDQAGTGWMTLDAKAAWRSGGMLGHVLSFGGHFDRYELMSKTYSSTDWTNYLHTTLTAASQGKTRTGAIWAQGEVSVGPAISLTLGARQEWWRAYDGFNKTTAANPGIIQAERRASGSSPKLSVAWHQDAWSARLSMAQAWRFPTIGELYGATTVGSVLANPNPGLRPERARSAELAIERKSDKGSVRLSLFNELVDDALISQTGTISALQPNGAITTVTASFVQNVDRTRARGVEIAIDERDFVPDFDIAASLTYADAITSKDTVFPAAVGKLLPSVPHWKANAVVTWRPADRWSLTGAARMSSRNFATLDNSDVFADTYQGFDKFFVVDLRAAYKLNEHVDVAIGVDNVNNHRYFLFHPFPRRSVTAELRWKL